MNTANTLYNQIKSICDSEVTPYDKEYQIRVLIDSVPSTKASSICGRRTSYTFEDSSKLIEQFDEDFGGSLDFRTIEEDCDWVGIEYNYPDPNELTEEEEEEYLRFREEGWSN